MKLLISACFIFMFLVCHAQIDGDVSLLSGKSFQNTNRLVGGDTSLVKFANDSILYVYALTADSIRPLGTFFYEFDNRDKLTCKMTMYGVVGIDDQGQIQKGQVQRGIIRFVSEHEFIWRENTLNPADRPLNFLPSGHQDNVIFVRSRF